MARQKRKLIPVGRTRVSPNGYSYTMTEEGQRLTHHLVAETYILKRPLRKGERVYFIDSDKKNLDPSNLEVYPIKEDLSAEVD